jgi:hypothetical protein
LRHGNRAPSRWVQPDRRIRQQCQHNGALVLSQGGCELAAPQDLARFGHHRLRESDDILAPCLQKRLPGNAVTLERRTDDGARINDDQCRRSAL